MKKGNEIEHMIGSKEGPLLWQGAVFFYKRNTIPHQGAIRNYITILSKAYATVPVSV
jgi:hypothetical protein